MIRWIGWGESSGRRIEAGQPEKEDKQAREEWIRDEWIQGGKFS